MNKRPTYRSSQEDFEKYFEDKLSEAERHRLEKTGLDDAFEADAMEGWEEVDVDSARSDLKSLREDIHQNKKSPMVWWQMAAAVAILVIAGIWVFQISLDQPEPELAQTLNESDHRTDSDKSAIEADESDIPETLEQEEEIVEEPLPIAAEPLSEDSVLGESNFANIPISTPTENTAGKPGAISSPSRTAAPSLSKKKIDDEDFVAALDAAEDLILSEEPKEADVVPLTTEGAENAISYNNSTGKFAYSQDKPIEVRSRTEFGYRQLVGNITADDGQSLQGASIQLDGVPIGAVSDGDGWFEMSIPDSIDTPTLTFSNLGYSQKKYQLNKFDTFNVTLVPTSQALLSSRISEEDFMGDEEVLFFDELASETEQPTIEAKPVEGYKKFGKYLRKNTKKPQAAKQNDIKGPVVLTVTVGSSGEILDIKVIRELGYGCDEEAVRVVREGPSWAPALKDGKPVESQVTFGVRFR